jgi:arylsulfatase
MSLTLSPVAAQQPNVDRTILPPPDPPFRGDIKMAYKDSKGEFPQPLRAPKGAPNVLLIMGDDIGYGHMSAFGGPANTPNFDRVARQGLTYTNFHTTAVCAASRAALLTGRNAHNVGMGSVPETAVGFPGYTSIDNGGAKRNVGGD